MKIGFVISLMGCLLCVGCQDRKEDDCKGLMTSQQKTDVPISGNEFVQRGDCVDQIDQRTSFLMRLDKISRLWPTNFMGAYREIESLRSVNSTSFFHEATSCRKYVGFFRDLKFELVPLEKRYNYIGGVYSHLIHWLSVSAEEYPRNVEFVYIFCAEYISKLRSEYEIVCNLLENLPPLPELPPLQYPKDGKGLPLRFLATKEQKELWDRHSERRHELDVLNKYKRRLSYELEKRLRGLDSKYARQKINEIPEPRRTEVINYIESKIGRRMKWRE